jgi:hypothetical protein
MNWSKNILAFLDELSMDEKLLPAQVAPLYPLKGENGETIRRMVTEFYQKYYQDVLPRRMLIGINPGRLGAGATGIPFTDTKRLAAFCGIGSDDLNTHETSSVFMYDMIEKYGGPAVFYRNFYITSVSSIGFVKSNAAGNWVNFNYYDDRQFAKKIEPVVVAQLQAQISFGARTDIAYCLGTGKNFQYLSALNEKHKLFGQVMPLEHPRYIMQYKLRSKQDYIQKYLECLSL